MGFGYTVADSSWHCVGGHVGGRGLLLNTCYKDSLVQVRVQASVISDFLTGLLMNRAIRSKLWTFPPLSLLCFVSTLLPSIPVLVSSGWLVLLLFHLLLFDQCSTVKIPLEVR